MVCPYAYNWIIDKWGLLLLFFVKASQTIFRQSVQHIATIFLKQYKCLIRIPFNPRIAHIARCPIFTNMRICINRRTLRENEHTGKIIRIARGQQ